MLAATPGASRVRHDPPDGYTIALLEAPNPFSRPPVNPPLNRVYSLSFVKMRPGWAHQN